MNRSLRIQKSIPTSLCLVAGCLAVLVAITLANQVSAQDSDAQGDRAAQQKEDRRIAIEQLRQQAEQQRQLLRQREAVLKQQQAALQQQLDVMRAEFEAQREAYERQAAAMTAKAEDYYARLVGGKEGHIEVFRLKYLPANEAADTITEALGNAAPRLATDERANSLVIVGSESQLTMVKTLLQELDTPAPAPVTEKRSSTPVETVQLRILWLMDGLPEGTGREPDSRSIDPQVIDALREGLGFQDPKIVTQQLVALLVDEQGAAGRTRDRWSNQQFQFGSSGELHDAPCNFHGQGLVAPTGDGRYAVHLEMQVNQHDNPAEATIAGSIVTPPDHYMVVGTTTFLPLATESNLQPQQQLSALVIYLSRAQELPTGEAVEPRKR